ncbi:MAG: peptidylprolyl isomerase [Pseudomonadales bacterium]|nr:peptidylprolyl isomerase [Pseudomonadales bacterium]
MRRVVLVFVFLISTNAGFAPSATAEAAAEVVEKVRLTTTLGVIEADLYPERAPRTVANFLAYVDAGLYNNASFYRVVRLDNQPASPVRIEVIQGGRGPATYDPDTHPPFPPLVHETTRESGLSHVDGALSMARLAPGSATSEFFICIGPQPELDFGGARNPDGQGFAVFGQVTAGMEVVRAIQAGRTQGAAPDYLRTIDGQMLTEPVVIEQVGRVE